MMLGRTLVVLILVGAIAGEVVTEDCSETEGAALENNVCVCSDKDSVISSDRSACIPITFGGYGSSCNDTAQCVARMETGARCEEGVCVCIENFHYLHGRCWKNHGFGSACAKNESCYDFFSSDTLTCKDDKCQCGSSTYSPVKGMCRRQANAGEPCDFDLDCAGDTLCDTTSYLCQGTPSVKLDVEETTSSDDQPPVTTCPNCTDPNKMCSPGGQCICSMGYYDPAGNGTCLLELGESCISDSNCSHIEMAVCRRSGSTGGRICDCGGSWIADGSKHLCLKNRKNNFNCQQDEQCSYFGGVCRQGRCACPEGSYFIDNICWPYVGLGETCSEPNDCYVTTTGAVNCTDKVCQCVEGYHNTSTGDCWKHPQALGDNCEEAEECDFVGDMSSVICKNSQCACQEGYQRENSTSCAVGLGGPCQADGDCSAVPSSSCQNNKCGCAEGFIVNPDEPECLKVAVEYRDNCSISLQCTPQLGETAYCYQGHCVCSSKYHYKDGKCWLIKRLGEDCSTATECYLPEYPGRIECRKSVCHCKYDYLENTSNNVCASSSTSLAISIMSVILWCLIVQLS